MINIEIHIEATGRSNINNIQTIISYCDQLRFKSGVEGVNIKVIAENVSSFVENPLNSCSTANSSDCNLTLEQLTEDIEK